MSKKSNAQTSGGRKRSGGLNTTYLTKMGLRNLVVNRTMTISSVSVLTACLLLIGISTLLVFNIQILVKDVENQNVVVVFANDGLDQTGLDQIRSDLEQIENVTDVEFVSREQAFDEQMKIIEVDEADLENIGIENPLPDSFRVTVKDIDSFDSTLAKINEIDNIQYVRNDQEIVNQISTLQKSVTIVCVVIVAVLVVVSLFIIGNTIRITMVSRKIDIQVMKSVGATNAFISWPFMIEGIFIGILSGLLAMGLTYALQISEGNALNSLLELFGSSTFTVTDFLWWYIGGYIVAGILLGSFGSVVSLKRYLRKEGSESQLNN
ncbi:MAG: permease-like cell division protein FtsX [Clostridia bacterium]|nr:permease-like cell division protein FtsX [Clostridia bacterium]